MCRTKSVKIQALQTDTPQSDETHQLHTPAQSFFISTLHGMGNSWLETISACGTSVTYKLDTGAQVNIMPRRVYSRLPSKPPIQPAHVKIFAYGSTAPLPVDGQCTCDVVVNGGASRLLRFYVVSADSEPLLSLNACKELGLIQRLCVTNGVRPHTNTAAGLNGMYD